MVRKEDYMEILSFTLKLLALSVVLYFISWNVNLYSFQEFTAERVYDSLIHSGVPAVIENTRITVGEFDFLITEDCTAWKGMFLFFALLVSTGKKLKDTGKGLFIGLPVVYSLNLIRILFIVISTTRFGPGAYDFFHGILWNLTMVAAVIVLWTMWRGRTNFLTREDN